MARRSSRGSVYNKRSNEQVQTARTSGGGGGGINSSSRGGDGGSGVVILKVPSALYSGTTTGSPTVSVSGSDRIIKFTSNGTYTA